VLEDGEGEEKKMYLLYLYAFGCSMDYEPSILTYSTVQLCSAAQVATATSTYALMVNGEAK